MTRPQSTTRADNLPEQLDLEKRTEIGELIDQLPLSSLQIRVIVLCALVVMLDGYDIQNISLAVPSLARDWSLPSSAFSFVLATGLTGIALGAAFMAPLGDRWGRKRVMVASSVIVGIASVATGLSTELSHLVLWRLLTGLGLGASVPNAIALTSEYMPTRRRAALTILMLSNISGGAFIAGFVAPMLIEASGWHMIFFLGGIVPLLLCPVLMFALPDSLKFLVLRNPEDRRIAAVLAKIAPVADPGSVYVREQERVERQSVIELLSPSFRSRTLLLWYIFILNSFALYMLITWLPTLLTSAGWSNTQALRGAVMIQAGGIGGALMISWLIDRGKTVGALIGAYCAAAITLGLFSVVPSDAAWWLMLLIVGAGLSGAQGAFNILSALFYPASIRATGVGWAASASRVGAILSPLIGGLIVQQEFSAGSVMGMLVIPVAISSIGVMMIPRALRSVQETAGC